MNCSGKSDCCENEDEAGEERRRALKEEMKRRWLEASQLADEVVNEMRGAIGIEISADAKFLARVKIAKFFYQKLEWEDMGDIPNA